nr:RNA-directed DNA polymerase, eukaryota [Tanacetum cinerariifolium]
MDFEENLDLLFARKRLCIKTKQEDNILKKFKVILKGKVFLVCAKELFAWTPTFLDSKKSEYNSDNESFHGEEYKHVGSQDSVHDLDDDSDVEGVSKTIFGDKPSSPNNSFCSRNEKEVEQHSEDPFNLYDLLKQKPKGAAPDSSSSFSHPLGFTPVALDSRQENIQTGDKHNHGSNKVNSSSVNARVMSNSQVVHDNVTSKEESALHSTHNSQTGGSSFTWSHPSASKMNKLDRFLVSEGIISLFPSVTALCLDRHLSDHRPILIRENSFSHYDTNGLVRFKKKLQDLKKIIRSWVKDKKLQQAGVINFIKSKLIDIDKNLDRGNFSDEILFKRMEMVQQLHDVKQMEARDNSQKSKIEWAIEGDENSKFFHDHFPERFKQHINGRIKLNIPFNIRLSTEQVVDLDRGVSRDEIRSAFWNCGENKSPGPDGYTFEFFRRYWRFVGPGFCFAVECFFDNGSFSMGSNSSFIALIPKVIDFRPISSIGCVYKVIRKILASRLATVISDLVFDTQSAFVANRQILDGPFILNELIALCKRKKKQAMIFKFDFAKAYDSSIVTILKCFFLASGLKINIQKSQVLGIGVPRTLVTQAASLIGYALMQRPFRYLGVMIGDCMSRKHAWDETIRNYMPDYLVGSVSSILVGILPLSVSSPSYLRTAISNYGVSLGRSLVKYIPIKINVFAWRVRLDRLPTRVNLFRRGFVLKSSLCPMCGYVVGGNWIGMTYFLSLIALADPPPLPTPPTTGIMVGEGKYTNRGGEDCGGLNVMVGGDGGEVVVADGGDGAQVHAELVSSSVIE